MKYLFVTLFAIVLACLASTCSARPNGGLCGHDGGVGVMLAGHGGGWSNGGNAGGHGGWSNGGNVGGHGGWSNGGNIGGHLGMINGGNIGGHLGMINGGNVGGHGGWSNGGGLGGSAGCGCSAPQVVGATWAAKLPGPGIQLLPASSHLVSLGHGHGNGHSCGH